MLQLLQPQEQINRQLSNTILISTDDLQKWDDEVHYSSAGQLVLGQRFGQALVHVMRKQSSLTQ